MVSPSKDLGSLVKEVVQRPKVGSAYLVVRVVSLLVGAGRMAVLHATTLHNGAFPDRAASPHGDVRDTVSPKATARKPVAKALNTVRKFRHKEEIL